MGMTSAPSQCTPGIDWITLRAEDDPQAQQAYERARALQAEQLMDGDRLRDFGAHGYIGHGTRHCRYGVKQGSVLVELSGDLADRYWREFLPLATTVTRLDTKVDVRFDREVRDLAVDAYKAPGVRINDRLPPVAKALYTGSAGGQTCYVGAMGGRRLGRLYDKSAESPRDTPPGVWRYELQERKPYCGVASRAIDSADDVPGAIAAYVHGYYARHGINPWFAAERIAVPGIPRRRTSDLSAWRDWIGRQAVPGMRRWLDPATQTQVMKLLGLPEDRAL